MKPDGWECQPTSLRFIRRNIKHPSTRQEKKRIASAEPWCYHTKLFCSGEEPCSKFGRTAATPTILSISKGLISWGLKSFSVLKSKVPRDLPSEDNEVNEPEGSSVIITDDQHRDDAQFSPLLEGLDLNAQNKWVKLLVSFDHLSEKFDEALNITDETIKNYISKVSKSRTVADAVWSYYHRKDKPWLFTEPVKLGEDPETSDYELLYDDSCQNDLTPTSLDQDMMVVHTNVECPVPLDFTELEPSIEDLGPLELIFECYTELEASLEDLKPVELIFELVDPMVDQD